MKVMVLGGGNCQLNLIERLKAQGDEVILVDYLKDCPASSLCDEHLLISTFDTEEVMKAAQSREIEAIVTLGTDQPVYTAAAVAAEMVLPFYLTPKQALSATNKKVMKKKFSDAGIPTAAYALIGEDFTQKDIAGITFPAVLKPVDSQGQRGIYKVYNEAEIREYIKDTLSYSRQSEALLEEYYESDEITVNGWLRKEELTLLSVVDRVTLESDSHIGICIAHNFPSLHLQNYYEEIENITQKITEVFGFKSGPVYFQYLIGYEGIKVNEIAMRIGGAYEDITLPKIAGIDVLDMLLGEVMEGNTEPDTLKEYNLKNNMKYVSTQMFFLKPGTISEISYDEKELKNCGADKIYIAKQEGNVVGGIENATARAGYFIVESDNAEELAENINKAYDCIKIIDANGINMIKRYYDYPNRYKFASEKILL